MPKNQGSCSGLNTRNSTPSALLGSCFQECGAGEGRGEIPLLACFGECMKHLEQMSSRKECGSKIRKWREERRARNSLVRDSSSPALYVVLV